MVDSLLVVCLSIIAISATHMFMKHRHNSKTVSSKGMTKVLHGKELEEHLVGVVRSAEPYRTPATPPRAREEELEARIKNLQCEVSRLTLLNNKLVKAIHSLGPHFLAVLIANEDNKEERGR